MADKKEKLFSDFSPASTEQWMEKVTADLKGADFEKKLVDRKSTRLNSSHRSLSRMPSSA